MNDFIKNYYSIDVVGIIKITEKVFRIKSKDNKYYSLKFINDDYENIFSNLSLIELTSL